MVTNINLVAPETEKRTLLTGKSTLALSIFLVLLALLVFGTVSYFKSRYRAQVAQTESDIAVEKTKMAGKTYSDLFDFQERLTLLGGVLDSHSYWDSFLKNFSQYVIPDVRLTNFSFNEKDMTFILQGIASNFDVLSREIILLKSYPGSDGIEFRSANESASGEGGQSGVIFGLNIKVNPSVFKK